MAHGACHYGSLGIVRQGPRRVDEGDAAALRDCHAVGDGLRLSLVVGHEDGYNGELAQRRGQIVAESVAQRRPE
ncbi:hypothetical protein DKT77_01970 [Meridianimarinicoccus roseus]|uniref:Uncharacterized protein n=1 Tax=Meridianimarinicoccus roseus TaxID=2072018 RepID=A0A2V2LH59_9RHOB|nr:hypothetical protein DKT77_01970 [Meridianimarinicoccus roseus]